jgi:hypothetical protein
MDLRVIFLKGLFFFSGFSMAADSKLIYGYVEKAILVDKGVVLSAKLDTGAKSASLSAIHIHRVTREGKTYLKFIVPSKTDETEFTAEYLGRVKIKSRAHENAFSTEEATYIRRPVVLMAIQIGNKIRKIPVNLTNRKRFNYPLLLGRDALIAFDGLIDPSHAFLVTSKKNEVK